MKLLENLLDLCKINSISGYEDNIIEYLKTKLKNLSYEIITTPLKSIILKENVKVKKENNLKIAIEAHIDSVGFVVKSITKEGFLKIINCGGIDAKSLIFNEVIVCGKKIFNGFIFINNNETNVEKNKKITIDDLLVDVGLNNEDATKFISKGDQILFSYNPIYLKNNRLSVRFLDNRSSVAVMLCLIEKLKNIELNCNLEFLFSSLEETSQGGITTAGFLEKPDIAICIDVSFAQNLNCKDNGIGKMGKGPLIGISPVLDKNLTNKLIETAKEKNIPFQLEIMNGLTRTDADHISTLKDGVLTSLCSIPISNMHTSVEMLDLKDLENTINLIYHFLTSF